LLLRGRVIPIIPLVIIPVLAALVTGFGLVDIGEFFEDGISRVIDVAIMFIFAILYFGIMQSVGLFDPLINKMIQLTRGNIVTISIGTVVIAAIAQLDGSGASTFLITIPALLPLYNLMKIVLYFLLFFISGSAATMNMLSWVGPFGRSSSVLDLNVTELWRPLIPIQIIGMIFMLALAIFLGYREKKRIERRYGAVNIGAEEQDEMKSLNVTSLKLFWFRSEEHTSELQSRFDLVCRLVLEKKNSISEYDITDE